MQLVFQVPSADLGRGSQPNIKWSRNSQYLACYGNTNQVFVFDRSGSKIAQLPIANPNLMDWDNQSKLLAVSSSQSNVLQVFSLARRELLPVEVPFEPTWIHFSRSGSYLAAGSDRGKFWISDQSNQQFQTYQGTHDKSIIDGCWNSKKQLALCSEDQSVSVNSINGEIVARKDINDVPMFPQFIKIDNNHCLVFAGTQKPVIYVWNYSNGDTINEVTFSSDHGKILRCTVLTNLHIFVHFSSGKYALVSFDGKIPVERQAFTASSMKSDAILSKALITAGSSVKYISMSDIQNITEEQHHFPHDCQYDSTSISLSGDGTLGAIGIANGSILVYLIEVPVLCASRGPLAVYSESLTSLVVFDMHKRKYKRIEVETQPQRIGVCQTKLAVAFNNQSLFYSIDDCSLISKSEFSASIDAIQVSSTAFAVLMGGKVSLNYFDKSKQPFMFPDFELNANVTAFSLTDFLLLLATDDGSLRIFNTRNQAFLDTYKHKLPIVSITPNLSETRFAIVDTQGGVSLFNPIKKIALEADSNVKIERGSALFDTSDRNVFLVVGEKSVTTFHFTDHNVDGPVIKMLNTFQVPSLKAPLGVSNGKLIFLDGQSTEQTQLLPSHGNIEGNTAETVKQLLNLHRHRKALQIAIQIGDKSLIKMVGDSAMSSLSIEIAAEAYSLCGDAATYNILSPIKHEEEYTYIRGYVSMLNKDFTSAQKSFIESTRPQMALDMRAALLQFDFALKLAESMDPSRIPQLSLDSARQNELTDNYSAALNQYIVAMRTPALAKPAKAGIIRCLILSGKVEKGMRQLAKSHDVKLITECAHILEKLCAYIQAAQLYTQVEQFNSAAQCYLRANDLKSAASLVPKVTDSKVLRSIGLQMERNGMLDGAVMAFEQANEWDSLVRVLLKVNLDKATAVARDHPTVTACRLVAEHCIQLNNFRYAIEFLIRAGKSEDAFRIAQLHERMDELAELIGETGTSTQYSEIATYFISRNQLLSAAKFFAKAGDPGRALQCFMSDGSEAALEGALDLAERTSDRGLRDSLLEYLTTQITNKPSDIRYLLRMFIIMQQFEEAAATALRISDDFRARGEYTPCREILFDIMRQLMKHRVPISSDMKSAFMIIHSYLLIKPMKDINKVYSALLLRRISKHISKFQKHGSAILTSAVVTLTQVGMKKSAFECATKVLSPEYEGMIRQDLLKKIQTIVRRRDMNEVEEEQTACPVCGANLHISELYCGSCKSNLPFCTISGMHMTKDDWCECPSCHFPASHKLMCEKKRCPLCNESISVPELITNPRIR